MSGDGSRVLYNANDSVGYRTFSAPSDGIGTIEVLGAAADFTGGKTKVSGAFVFQHRNDGVYRMSADLSLPPVKMHDPLPGYGTVAGGSVVPFSDGSRVAFISDMDVDEIFDLWVADDDRQELAFDATGVTVGEGAGTIQVTVRLTQTAARDISFTWSLSGTATDGVDYDVVTGTPAIVPEGSLETTIELAILDDGVDEPDETLILSLDSVGTTIGTPGSFTVTIEDDDVGGVDPLIFADGFESGDTAEWNP